MGRQAISGDKASNLFLCTSEHFIVTFIELTTMFICGKPGAV